MKKMIAVTVLIFTIVCCLCGCFSTPQEPETTTVISYVTDINGDLVPAHSNVNASVLDAHLFKTDERGRVYYSEPSVKTYTGVDVSVFQGDIDWNKVHNDGIDFVMLRAGFRGYGPNGLLNKDEMFEKNCSDAIKAGLKVGVYFFSQAINAKEAQAEADFLLDIIKDFNITYPIAYDWETIDYDTARTDDMTGQQISECALAFCSRIKSAGYTPIIYFNCELGYFNYDLSTVKDYNFWLAEYSGVPSFYYDYKIWQYTKKGTVDGIDGNVDLNISIIDYSNSHSLG